MERTDTCVELVLKILRESRGVEALRVLTEAEKNSILKVELQAEEKIAYSMCKTLNSGVREALQRDYSVATLIDSSIYEYPHHPSMVMTCDDTIVGEQVKDPSRISELKGDRSNFFLWDNFVIYTPRLPREKEAKKRLRMVYKPMTVQQLEDVTCVEESVFGTPSMEGDALVKDLLDYHTTDPEIGTCLVGFNVMKQGA
ncbi:MAG: hypothetical protein NWE89_03945 [Candidatus Bathyarchaeota archaeon]|nr:hypothetical protein [Candidatus Bathyarchaeota archaeon]